MPVHCFLSSSYLARQLKHVTITRCTRAFIVKELFGTAYILRHNATKSTHTARCQWFHWVHTLCSRSPTWRSLLQRTTALHSWPGWLNSSPGETLWRVTTCNKVHSAVLMRYSHVAFLPLSLKISARVPWFSVSVVPNLGVGTPQSIIRQLKEWDRKHILHTCFCFLFFTFYFHLCFILSFLSFSGCFLLFKTAKFFKLSNLRMKNLKGWEPDH